MGDRLYAWQEKAQNEGKGIWKDASSLLDLLQLPGSLDDPKLDDIGDNAGSVIGKSNRYAKGLWSRYAQPAI
ncbi:hypothetical protein [Vreelandella sulfidaeris]